MTRQILLSYSMFGALLMIGCAASAPERTTPERNENVEGLNRFERTFNPADYDPEIPMERPEAEANVILPEEPPETDIETEIVSGFRVQISFTDNIEQANKIKDEVAAAFTGYPVYIVYEAPYYKVRVGDFLNRPEANMTHRELVEWGYKDAWVVPDKVKRQE